MHATILTKARRPHSIRTSSARLGGPIMRDKMFFFLSCEGFRQIQPTTDYGTFGRAVGR